MVQTEIYVGVIVVIALAAIIYYFASARKREKEAVTEKPMVERARTLVREVEKEEEKLVTVPEVAIDLTELRGIGSKRAEKLKVAGIKNVQDLAESNPGNVAKALGFSEKRSSRLISEAHSLLENYRVIPKFGRPG